MFEYDKRLLGGLEYTMLYPPEGDSSILAVSGENIRKFLHVMLDAKDELVFSFQSSTEMNLSENQMKQIIEKARKNLTLTDASMFE